VENLCSTARRRAPVKYYLEKDRPTIGEPRWTLHVNDVVLSNLSSGTLFDHNRLWKKVALAAELRVFFPVNSRAEHKSWLQPLLDECAP